MKVKEIGCKYRRYSIKLIDNFGVSYVELLDSIDRDFMLSRLCFPDDAHQIVKWMSRNAHL